MAAFILNTSIPLSEPKFEIFSTTADCQNNMEIKIVEIIKEGIEDKEKQIIKDLPKFDIYPLPQQPAGKVDVLVKFNIGNDCKLVVTYELSRIGFIEKGSPEFEEYNNQLSNEEQINAETERKNIIEIRIQENAKIIQNIYNKKNNK